MKLTKFDSLPGSTPLEKLTLWSKGQTIYTQQKFNGINARYFPATGRLVTRDDKYWDMGRFTKDFVKELADYSAGDVLHGELYFIGRPLQDIAGLLSVNGLEPIPDLDLAYAVYDIRIHGLSWDEQPYLTRLDKLSDKGTSYSIFDAYTNHCTPEQACNFYDRMIENNNEGCVYRISPCYDAGEPSTINCHAVKRKAKHEAEGRCVGYYEGRGKRKGMLGGLVVELPNGLRLSIGGGEGLTNAQLLELYINPPYGETITYTFEERSTSGIPLRPQFKAVRNYE